MKFYSQSEDSSSKDYSGIGILVSNALVIVYAMVENLDPGPMMVIYWAQSVIIGFFNFFRILLLKSFSTEGFTSNGTRVPETSKGKWSTALFFAVIDKDSLFHPFQNRPTGSPGIEGVRWFQDERRLTGIPSHRLSIANGLSFYSLVDKSPNQGNSRAAGGVTFRQLRFQQLGHKVFSCSKISEDSLKL